ncbi:hypothetical protein GW17_00056135 [Ensete ventricosum]|nr:hypothetical protein GW17_00056135 [Ensete ventricosum]
MVTGGNNRYLVVLYDSGWFAYRSVTDTRTIHYQVVLPKIDRWRSISTVDSRLRKKSIVGGRLREKRGRRRRGKKEKKEGEKKNLLSTRRPRPYVVAARGSPVRCRRLHAVATLARYRYADRPLSDGTIKIDRRQSIEGEKGKKNKKRKRRKKKRRRRKKSLLSPRRPRPCAVVALARVRFFSRARRLVGANSTSPPLLYASRFSLPSGKAPYHPVRTGPTADRYVDRPLPGGTTKIGRRRLISAVGGRFRLSVVDFDCRRSIEGEIDCQWSIEEGKGKKKRKRRKKKKRRSTSRRPRLHALAARRRHFAMREELALKAAILAEKFAPDLSW